MTRNKFCLSLHYNGANSYLFVNGTEITKFKTKDSETVATPLCLASISEDWSVDNMKKSGFNGYVYDLNMFAFIKKAFFTGLTILSSVNLLAVTPL